MNDSRNDKEPLMKIGDLYDQCIASTYDDDDNGFLAGGRALATRQIESHVEADKVSAVLDLAVGTGESLLVIQKLFPNADLSGIDLSAEMLRIARNKLDFQCINDAVENCESHFSQKSKDILLMHFLTTFVNGQEVVRSTSNLLRPGGYFSIVSSTFEAFPRVFSLAKDLLSEEFIRSRNPAPENTQAVASLCVQAGLELVAVERFTKDVSFQSLEDLLSFGMTSGFFTHVLSDINPAELERLPGLQDVFPLADRYCCAAVLARRPL